MNVQLWRGHKVRLTAKVQTFRLYGYQTADNTFTADVEITIDHAGLIDLIRKAQNNKSLRAKDGPVLVITDAQIDRVRIRREHAFLIPAGASLPFAARGPVFRFS